MMATPTMGWQMMRPPLMGIASNEYCQATDKGVTNNGIAKDGFNGNRAVDGGVANNGAVNDARWQ